MWQSAQLQRYLYAFGVGSFAGGTVGVVGWGGAQVIIPSMTMNYSFANLSQLSATGVSLTSLSLSTITSGFRFWRDDRVDMSTAMLIAIPAVASARFGTRLAQRLSGDALALFFNGFSIILIPTHFWIQERAKLRRAREQENTVAGQVATTRERPSHESHQELLKPNIQNNTETQPDVIWIQHASYGLISGIISALMGVGGLPLTMSYLTEATDLHHHYVQGTSICATVPSIAMSATSRIHAIPIHVAGWVCAGAIVGGYFGANFALHLEEEQLRNLYMGSLVVFGSRSILGASKNIQNIIREKRVFR